MQCASDRPRRVRNTCNRLLAPSQISTSKYWLALGVVEPCQSGAVTFTASGRPSTLKYYLQKNCGRPAGRMASRTTAVANDANVFCSPARKKFTTKGSAGLPNKDPSGGALSEHMPSRIKAMRIRHITSLLPGSVVSLIAFRIQLFETMQRCHPNLITQTCVRLEKRLIQYTYLRRRC